MRHKQHIDESDVQQDSPAEAMSEVHEPDDQVDEDLRANRVIALAPAGGGGTGVAVPATDSEK